MYFGTMGSSCRYRRRIVVIKVECGRLRFAVELLRPKSLTISLYIYEILNVELATCGRLFVDSRPCGQPPVERQSVPSTGRDFSGESQ